jgi:hypothetical protein
VQVGRRSHSFTCPAMCWAVLAVNARFLCALSLWSSFSFALTL